MQIDKEGFVKYPPIYLTDAQDLDPSCRSTWTRASISGAPRGRVVWL